MAAYSLTGPWTRLTSALMTHPTYRGIKHFVGSFINIYRGAIPGYGPGSKKAINRVDTDLKIDSDYGDYYSDYYYRIGFKLIVIDKDSLLRILF